MKYECLTCCYVTDRKSNYLNHLNSNKHKRLLEISPKLAEISPKLAEISPKLSKIKQNHSITQNNMDMIICKYCNKEFKHKSSLSKHVKYTCKKNDDEDLKELVRLLNEQITILNEQNNELKQNNNSMQKQINKLSKKLQVGNITNNTNYVNTTTNFNIKLLNYRDTDYSHLSHNDYLKCISDCNHCVKTLIEKVHINKKKPENMNVFIPSMKDKYIMVYNTDKWNLEDRKEVIDNMFDQNEWTLESFYDEYKETYPEMVKSFERYLENKEENDVVNQVKEKILLELYNERDTIRQKNNSLKND